MKRLPIGVEDFKELIDHQYYYIDKTMFIQDVLKEKVVLYTRPRRFGKTLNMSMLYYFFSIKQKENAYLFDGLNITKNKGAAQYQNQYPVILITLKDMKDIRFQNQIDIFKVIIRELIGKYKDLFTSERLDDIDKKLLICYQEGNVNIADLKNGLRFLSQCLYKHYQKKVILLIDEYDVPLQNAYLNAYYEEMTDFLGGIFSAALKTNEVLEKGILTGYLRIAKESIFTGLNNFKVNSIFDEVSGQQFGFSPMEISTLLQDYHFSEYQKDIKDWYDGYRFGKQDIYNPWSVLMYMDQLLNTSRKTPVSFWANTSGNDIIYRYIKEADATMRQEFEILSSGGYIEKPLKESLTYREMDQINNVYSFLLYTGYLKAINCVDEENSVYRLMIPNKEIKRIYTTIFEEWFQEQVKEIRSDFAEALRKEDVNLANELLNSILFESISYFDYDEKFYHGMLVGLFSNYQVLSNQESGLGRFDLAVLPFYKKKRGFLLELKVASKEEEVEHAAVQACEQIKEKQYLEGLKKKGYTDIVGYGIAFYKKSCLIVALP